MIRIIVAFFLTLYHLPVSVSFVHPVKNYGKIHQKLSSPSLSLRENSTSVGAVPTNSLAITLTSCKSIAHSDPSFVLTSMLLISIFGISLERRTTVGKALSAPLITMALALVAANTGVVPFSSPVYGIINKFLVPLAVPMLLFDSDMNRIVEDTGSLLLAFFVGAISTIIGTLVAYPLLPLNSLGQDIGWRVACALAARHIGGAINFVAVADTLNVGGTAVSAAIAADNVVVALYFVFLFYISKNGEGENSSTTEKENTIEDLSLTDPEDVTSESGTMTLPSLAISLSIASLLVTVGRFLTTAILPKGTSSLPLTSILTVTAATIFPGFFSRIRSSGTSVGIFFIQMFFAASGAAGNLLLVMKQAPSLFAFSFLQIGVHFGTLMTLGRWICRLPPRELYLASNANVGGPTTAAAMAQAKEWNRLILPALLVGILGYASATVIALALGPILLKLPLIG